MLSKASCRRCARRQQDACGDFVNIKICQSGLSEVFIEVGCACIYS
uniref:Uncharacterized protein n=1 Tax=Arundo donax TaxID=35708 RepID=A0A0A8YAP8_ARUDO